MVKATLPPKLQLLIQAGSVLSKYVQKSLTLRLRSRPSMLCCDVMQASSSKLLGSKQARRGHIEITASA